MDLKMKSIMECPLCGIEISSKEDYCPECRETIKKD